MLRNLRGEVVDKLPHQEEYDRRVARLRPEVLDELQRRINDYCDSHSSVKAGWLFGIEGFETMHRDLVSSCGGDEEEANLFLGQILWEVLRHRSDEWWFHRPEGGGDHPAGMRYDRG